MYIYVCIYIYIYSYIIFYFFFYCFLLICYVQSLDFIIVVVTFRHAKTCQFQCNLLLILILQNTAMILKNIHDYNYYGSESKF